MAQQHTKTTKKGRLHRETGIIFKEAAVSKKEKIIPTETISPSEDM